MEVTDNTYIVINNMCLTTAHYALSWCGGPQYPSSADAARRDVCYRNVAIYYTLHVILLLSRRFRKIFGVYE